MSQLPDDIVTAMARRFAEKSAQIALEICRTVGAGSPSHPRLHQDIGKAAFCALHSETFRALVVAIEAEAMAGVLDDHERLEYVLKYSRELHLHPVPNSGRWILPTREAIDDCRAYTELHLARVRKAPQDDASIESRENGPNYQQTTNAAPQGESGVGRGDS